MWGELAIDGHAELAAHLLANSPLGNAAKLAAKLVAKADGQRSVYETEFRRLVAIVVCVLRLT
ncbi:MAG: hypothetical protein KF850_24345 [Labilithrix sp.]|nr:hypothetical protein [Labilithrix sp.]